MEIKNYRIAKDGQVISLWYDRERVLKPWVTQEGYLRVKLYINGVKKNYLVHRLVAMTYLANYSEDLQVNHKNCIKTDNRVDNLEMVSNKENQSHARDNGLINTSKAYYFTEDDIKFIRSTDKTKMQLCNIYGCSPATIRRIRNGYTWSKVL